MFRYFPGRTSFILTSLVVFAMACIQVWRLVSGAPLSPGAVGFLWISIAWGSFALLLAAYYTRQLHRQFPDTSYWQKYFMFFSSPFEKMPDDAFGKALAPKLTYFRINAGAIFAVIWFGLIIYAFWGYKL